MQTPKIGIVTVLYNSGTVLEEFFRTLDLQTFRNFTLYVVDNKSSDDSLSKAAELSQQVNFRTVLIPESENWGVAKGNNIGIAQALKDGCDYILLSNNDIVLRPDTIEKLLEGMQQLGVTMAVPKIYFHDTGLLWCAGGRFSYLRGAVAHIGCREEDKGQYDRAGITEYAPTCFMLIDAGVFRRTGLMDERYFVYYDDTDFIWRATKQGKERLGYIPASTLRHKESTSTGGNMSDFSIYYLYRNHSYFTMKHHRFPQRWIVACYTFLHNHLRKPSQMTEAQRRLCLKAQRDGYELFRSTHK